MPDNAHTSPPQCTPRTTCRWPCGSPSTAVTWRGLSQRQSGSMTQAQLSMRPLWQVRRQQRPAGPALNAVLLQALLPWRVCTRFCCPAAGQGRCAVAPAHAPPPSPPKQPLHSCLCFRWWGRHLERGRGCADAAQGGHIAPGPVCRAAATGHSQRLCCRSRHQCGEPRPWPGLQLETATAQRVLQQPPSSQGAGCRAARPLQQQPGHTHTPACMTACT